MATTQVLAQESSQSDDAGCKCGAQDCLGHEVIDGQFQFPGFTSEAVMMKSSHKLIAFNCHVTQAFREAGE